MSIFLKNCSGSKRLFSIFALILISALYFVLSFYFETIASAETMSTKDYFPLESGLEWTYEQNGLNTVTMTVLSGSEYVNGVQTKVVRQSGGEYSGTKVYYTNDSNGIRRHKEFSPDVYIDGFDFADMTVILSPPMKYADQTATIGELNNSSGSAKITISGLGTFNLDYDSAIKIVGLENITVPLGNFDAIKIQSSLTLSGYIYGEYFTETTTSTYWLAEHIGPVKEQSGSNLYELTGINFSPPISADFSANPTDGITPLSVDFSDESTGYISGWYWDFGDGNSSTDQNPSHTYTSAGDYNVSLTVTVLGASDTITKSNYITVEYPPPVANFNTDTTAGIAPLTVHFTDASIGTITSWLWDFGDGSTSESQNPNNTYDKPGTYDVTLTITGPGGTKTETKEGYIRAADIGTDIVSDNSIDLKDAVLTLQVLTNAGSIPDDYEGTGIDADLKIGLEEVIYILQWVSEMR